MKIKFFHFLCLSTLLLTSLSLQTEAAILFQHGRIRDADEVATMPVQEHFSRGVAAMNCRDWDEAYKEFRIVVVNFPDSSFAPDSYFYLGIAYYNLGDFDFANEAFSDYLKVQNNPTYFEETLKFKFSIAQKFKEGARKHMFGTKYLPKWASGQSVALSTYDEVIAALPCHEIAAKALYSKGELLWEMRDYRESIDCFQTITRRFSKNEFAPQSYLAITEIYLEQSRMEFQNPDILALAQINLRRFKHDFPRDERIEEAESNVQEIKEVYAQGLYDTGMFYERVKKPYSSVLYYKNAINQFPETKVAQHCRQRLCALGESDTENTEG